MKTAGIFDDFDVIVCGDMVTKSKPNPDIYLKACELMKVDPKECYAVEDSYNGIRAAHAAGMKAIMVPDLLEPTPEILEPVSYTHLDVYKRQVIKETGNFVK